MEWAGVLDACFGSLDTLLVAWLVDPLINGAVAEECGLFFLSRSIEFEPS